MFSHIETNIYLIRIRAYISIVNSCLFVQEQSLAS